MAIPTRRAVSIVLTCLMGAALAVTASPARAQLPDTFIFSGYGSGHGVGLSMSGVRNRAAAGQGFEPILNTYYNSKSNVSWATVAGAYAGDGGLRVGIYSTTGSFSVAGEPSDHKGCSAAESSETIGLFADGAKQTDLAASEWAVLSFASPTYRADIGPLGGPAVRSFESTTPFTIAPGPSNILRIKEINGSSTCWDRYRGKILGRWGETSGRLWAINLLDVEDYARGIGEEPNDWVTGNTSGNMEAQKVLAVAARTYALYKRDAARAGNIYGNQGMDLGSSTGYTAYPGCCQYYVGVNGERSNLVAAAQQTTGRFLAYNGKAIVAAYSSNSGPYTADWVDVWGDPSKPSSYPYLVEVADPFFEPDRIARWSKSISRSDLQTKLNANGACTVGTLTSLDLSERSPAGRVRYVTITGSSATKRVRGETFASCAGLSSAFIYKQVWRIAGDNRYATGAALSTYGWPDPVGTVVVASGENAHLVDALAAGPLARGKGGPLLLTASDQLTPTTSSEIDRLAPMEVLIVGGETAVSSTVAAQIAGKGRSVTRIAGADRYATAAAVAQRMGLATSGPGQGHVLLASGLDGHLVDALAAGGPAAAGRMPILLAGDALPQATRDTLTALNPTHVLVIGGTAAVPQPVEDTVRQMGFDGRRIFGSDRYQTGAVLAGWAFDSVGVSPSQLLIVSGEDAHLVDALAAGPLGRAMLTTGSSPLAQAAKDFISGRRQAIGEATVVGGRDAISDDALNQASAALNS
ncbi:MAG: cell wall-binding repeat-containing protein [Actinomycetota bacterium]